MCDLPRIHPITTSATSVSRKHTGHIAVWLLAGLLGLLLAFAATVWFMSDGVPDVQTQVPPPLPAKPNNGTAQSLGGTQTNAQTVSTIDNALPRILALLESQNKQMIDLGQRLNALEQNLGQPNNPTNVGQTNIADATSNQALAQAIQTLNQRLDNTPASAQTSGLSSDALRILQAMDELPFEKQNQLLTDIRFRLDQLVGGTNGPTETGASLANQIQQAVAQALAQSPNQPMASWQTTTPGAPGSLGTTGTPGTPSNDPMSNAGLLPATPDGLTALQKAFRQAYLSGQAVRVGDRFDPISGERMPGRVLDPQTAYRAGHASWQAWYEADQAVEAQNAFKQANPNAVNPALTWEQ